jgi:bifunctional lysine-specific demethylase and histidyl-hydroxylase NO66
VPDGSRPSPGVGPDTGAGALTERDRDAGRAALARCVGDPDRFLAGPYGRGPHLHRDGGRFDDLLSLADVDEALTGRGLRHPAVRVVRDGEVIDRDRFTRTARTGRVRVDDLVEPGRLLDLFADGATIVLQALQRWWPPLTTLCRDLEVALGHPVQANAYLTPPGAAGLAPHHDTHDVFVLQVAGTKRWTLREPVLEAPLDRHHSDHDVAATQPVLLQAELGPGDALYMPRGVVHSAAAQERLSLHLTVGILAITAHDVARRLLDRAADDVAFRQDLPPGYAFDPDLARKAVAGVVQQLVGWLDHLDDLDTAAEADELCESFLTSRTPRLGGHLLELAELGTLDDSTVVRRRTGTLCTITRPHGDDGDDDGDGDGDDSEPTELRVTLGDRQLGLPLTLEPAVRRLLDGHPHPVAELADLLDGPSRLVLVRRLLREGALVTERAGARG